MKVIIISLLVGIFLMVGVSAAMDPVPAYCEHQGYTFEYGHDEDGMYYSFCVFDENNKCDANDFIIGECGQEYEKDIACRQEGEVLFHFEECCDGLESSYGWWNRGMIGQPSCVEKINFFQKLWRWIF